SERRGASRFRPCRGTARPGAADGRSCPCSPCLPPRSDPRGRRWRPRQLEQVLGTVAAVVGGLELVRARGTAGRPACDASKLLEGETHFASAPAVTGHGRPPLVLAVAWRQEAFRGAKWLEECESRQLDPCGVIRKGDAKVSQIHVQASHLNPKLLWNLARLPLHQYGTRRSHY